MSRSVGCLSLIRKAFFGKFSCSILFNSSTSLSSIYDKYADVSKSDRRFFKTDRSP